MSRFLAMHPWMSFPITKRVVIVCEWEVGLYSISYPNTWYTIQNSTKDTHVYYKDRVSWARAVMEVPGPY